MTRRKAFIASGVSRSPMCWERKTWRPTLSATAVFMCAPTARMTGSSSATGTGSGAYPRARRRTRGAPAAMRTTLSSACRSIGRSCTRKTSAIPTRRESASSSSVQIGSSLRFPLVATRGASTARSSRWWSGVAGSMSPSSGRPGATARATASSPRRGRRTMGASADSRSAAAAGEISASDRAAARSLTMRAKGLSSRALRARSRATAASFRASHIRWKPPRPLHARTSPRRSTSAATASASSPRASTSPDPRPGRELRPAGGTGRRLRVKAAVERVLVLGPALRDRARSRASSCSGGRRGGRGRS